MVRFIVSTLLGVAVTFALFVLMAFLISGGAKRYDDGGNSVVIEILSTPPKSSIQQRKRVPPPPPPPPKSPPKPSAPEPEMNSSNSGITFNVPGVELAGASTSLDAPGAGFGRDGEATPIVRIEPKYPIQAARDGKEGWVQLRFTIDQLGGVKDVEVIAAEPKRIFDKEAKRALRKWKYKPKVVDGKAIEQQGMTVQLDFKMNNDGGAQ